MIAADGATANEPIQLVGQTRPFPVTFYDANAFSYTALGDGSLTGTGNEFNTSELDVISNEDDEQFAGNTTATSTNNGRELDIQGRISQNGLTITRKIFVPIDGYFARYIEVLQNPSGNPITVALKFTTGVVFVNGSGFLVSPQIVATSSGDNVLDVSSTANPDHWIVIEDTAVDAGVGGGQTLPSIADIFAGPGAALRASSASWLSDTVLRQGILQEEFDGITVPPGGQISLLHFVVTQSNNTSALDSAQRLIQLPPEALAGIAPQDISTIQNFAMPPNGTSSVPPLEPLTGQVFGHVLASDASTPMSNVAVTFQSNDPLFSRTLSTVSDETAIIVLWRNSAVREASPPLPSP